MKTGVMMLTIQLCITGINDMLNMGYITMFLDMYNLACETACRNVMKSWAKTQHT